jgi:hypothetical protein
VAPGRYVVELSNPSLGTLARVGNRSTLAAARRARITVEQRSARLWVEQRHGRVISELTGLGYPLVSRPENKALTNNKIIVARDYAQFYTINNQADTAADRYGHGAATAMCAAGVPNQAPFGRISGVAPKACSASIRSPR